jgi:hypothetical protein
VDRPDPKFDEGDEVYTPSGGDPCVVEARSFQEWKGVWIYALRGRFASYREDQLELSGGAYNARRDPGQ